jgi:hypothetical protein|nr:MAG TPA: hypothetical protein [Caudoviricetes sp.]
MPAQKKTTLGLNQWIGSEYPKRIDFVEDNKIINNELENRVKYTDLAEENKAGIITYTKIKEIAPKPDLSPYIRWDKGYRTKGEANNEVVLTRSSDNVTQTWTGNHLHQHQYDGAYTGTLHTNGIRAYYKVPQRAGGGWCEIMDNHDMIARDNRMNNMDADRQNLWAKSNDAWNKAHDAQLNRIYEIRLAGYIELVRHNYGAVERGGYVVTGIKTQASNQDFWVQMRVLQFHRNGQWLNAYFA